MGKARKLIASFICSLTMLLAFSTVVFAMDFDAETAYESIFVIYSGNYIGSGFAIGANTVVTNAHVIGDSSDITICTYEDSTYRASIYLIDNTFDIAILSVDGADFTPLSIGDSDSVNVGDEIYAIGAPESMAYTLTKGVISNKDRQVGQYSYLQIDAAINSGNSGGPLLNSSGQVIGVNSMKMSDAEGIGLAIPINSVNEFIQNNGVAVSDGNVNEVLPYIENIPEEGNNTEDESTNSSTKLIYSSKAKTTILVLSIFLGISILVNVILIIILVYKSNKNKDYPPDKSERTDFEIDILE